MARRQKEVLGKKHLTRRQRLYPRLGSDPESLNKKAYMETYSFQLLFSAVHGFGYFPDKEPLSAYEANITCRRRNRVPRRIVDRRRLRRTV